MKYFHTGCQESLTPEQRANFPHKEYNDLVETYGGRPNLLYLVKKYIYLFYFFCD